MDGAPAPAPFAAGVLLPLPLPLAGPQPTSQPDSLAEALKAGEQAFRNILEQAPALPKLSESFRAPLTLSDAIAAVHQREDERKKKEAFKKDVKSKSKQLGGDTLATAASGPGAQIGSPLDASAFWMFVEVRACVRRWLPGGRAGGGAPA